MEAQGVTTLSDALRNVPGISLQAGEGGGASNTSGDMFNLRGFSANNSLFVDGVRDDGLMSRDVFNLEQVEVFMGPTGSDVGRGNAAGYVNMQTKTPLRRVGLHGDLRATAAAIRTAPPSISTTRSRSATGQLARAHRRSASMRSGKTAACPGATSSTRKNQSIAPSIALGSEHADACHRRRADHAAGQPAGLRHSRLGVDANISWRRRRSSPTTPVDTRNFYGSVGYDYDKVEQESYTARVEHDVNSSLTLQKPDALQPDASRRRSFPRCRSPRASCPRRRRSTIARQGNERENEILSNQTSLVGTRSRRGACVTRRTPASSSPAKSSSRRRSAGWARCGLQVSIYNPNPVRCRHGLRPDANASRTTGERRTRSGCMPSTRIELGARWQLSGGLRWEHYDAAFKVADATGALTTDLTTSDGLVQRQGGRALSIDRCGQHLRRRTARA